MQLTQYQEFIHKSRYARYLPEKKRRENWDETVDRWVDFFANRFPQFEHKIRDEVGPAIYNMDIFPSMRGMMTAGPALTRSELAIYNCSGISGKIAFNRLL